MDNEIRIFHYRWRQSMGTYWAILSGGSLYFVEKWTSHVPIQSQEHCHLRHPGHMEGKENLPNFHLLCFGKLDLMNNTAQILPIGS